MQSKRRKPRAPDPRKKLSPAAKKRALAEGHVDAVEQDTFEEVMRRLVTTPATRGRK
jgi:hypothetical protein